MNCHSNTNHIYQSISYSFNADIEKVYSIFFTKKILEKAGIFGVLFEFGTINRDGHTLIQYKFLNGFSFEFIKEKEIKNPDNICITNKILLMNNKEVTSSLKLRYNLYKNTSNNSTFVTFETLYEDENDVFYKEYFNWVNKDNKYLFCEKIQNYITHWTKNVISFESILIDRPLSQIIELFKDFNALLKITTNDYYNFSYTQKNKAPFKIDSIIYKHDTIYFKLSRQLSSNKSIKLNFLLIRISPITSYVTIEDEIPIDICQGAHIFTHLKRILLKRMKSIIESKALHW